MARATLFLKNHLIPAPVWRSNSKVPATSGSQMLVEVTPAPLCTNGIQRTPVVKYSASAGPGQQCKLCSSWLEYSSFSIINTQAKPVNLSRGELITTSRRDFLFWQNEMARET